ncbi:tetratricopeptide (TPR) repeat protein [Pedobacter cryoconitis]|uniref:Tetratricopeptide (TPR) repeat protein n=1 Tax=Pedobacter cryoconitis TaxID=188932 RepID=A0A7W9E0W1_9SPHI|nr:tetratricopeptide repeat protein [Pedobacter cryoconitis]MBB5638842.1 tetratricopeptide (TPR) repeat protein [Pedobacter cryoconitis]
MKTYIKNIFIATAISISFLSCKKDNPNITDEVYLNTTNVSTTWLAGLKRQMALTMNQVIVNTELVSDNYYNNRTLSNKVFDIPQIDNFDLDVNNIQSAIQRLRESSEYGLTTVINADKTTTAVQKAEMYFINAYSHLLSGELFTGLPGAAKGVVLSPAQHYALAITALDQALALQTDAGEKLAYTLLKARVYYDMGDAVQARIFATAAMANPLLLKQQAFDGQNGAPNDFQTYIFSSTTNEFAPLPRLDFLDPKYYNTTTIALDQKPVSYIKSEEAYLIVAEVQVSGNDLTGAQTTLKNLLTDVIAKRPVVSLSDVKETRNGGNRTDYPLTAVKVQFDKNDIERSGYVLNRKIANINISTVSGTMVTADDINSATTQDALLYLVYRMRQEIFISEGRRMTDLGIKFPVSQTEQLNNPNVKPADLVAQIPAFIPKNREMDDFTNNTATGVVTMKYDMNKVMVANKTAKEIFPFIN